MQTVTKFLQKNINGFLATIDNGKPKVRPFQFMLSEGGRLFFCTSNAKDVYQQLKVNPAIEFSSASPEFAWIRLSGQAKFSNDLAIKAKILEVNGLVKSLYQTPDNPAFEIFYLDHGTAILADFSGQPPKQITF